MHMRICAAAAFAVLQAFAFSAHAEDLHKDGISTSGARLSYETTVLPSGKLEITFTLECRQTKLDPIHGVGAFAVISKMTTPANIQRNQLSCTAKGGLDKLPVSDKVTGKMIMSGVSAADIGTKLFVVGRVETGRSPRIEGIMKKADAALDTEIAKVTAS